MKISFYKNIAVGLVVFLILSECRGQESCDSLNLLKNQFYGFDPESLSDEEKENKAKDLDLYWDYVKRNQISSLSCLAGQIENEQEDGYFLFDASSLLLRLDTGKVYRKIAMSGLERSNTNKIHLETFFQIILYLAGEGEDVSTLARKYLESPDPSIFLSMHFFTLNRTYAGVMIYGLIDDESATNELIKIMESESPYYTKHSASFILFYQNTEKGNAFLDSIKGTGMLADSTLEGHKYVSEMYNRIPEKKGNYSRQNMLEKLSWLPYNFEEEWFGISGDEEFMYSAYKNLLPEDIETIRNARYRAIYAPSDESLYEYLAVTKVLFLVKGKERK